MVPRGRVVSCQQNPGASHGVTSLKQLLQTAIRNCGIAFDTDSSIARFFTPEELLITQGFPVSTQSKPVPLCSFNLLRAGRSRTTVVGQAGNSMNVNVVGTMVNYTLSTPLPRINLARPPSQTCIVDEDEVSQNSFAEVSVNMLA